jgi:hypothetical protein
MVSRIFPSIFSSCFVEIMFHEKNAPTATASEIVFLATESIKNKIICGKILFLSYLSKALQCACKFIFLLNFNIYVFDRYEKFEKREEKNVLFFKIYSAFIFLVDLCEMNKT